MKGIEQWFEEYGQSHRHPVNVAIHKLAVPGIYLCSLGLLWSLPAGPLPAPLNWAVVAAIPVLLFYLSLSFSLFAGMAGLTALGLWICYQWQGPLLWPAVAAFVLLWIAQFVGHRIKGKRPSFLADLQFLLIGPAWVLASLYRRLRLPY
ncbi:DUF962 domain-containing protein [Aeromonas finlandensis]|uniref:Mpo1 family 2-hydroxy fatty acid dioxygenase n=1 Tax=Aeromonas finlandensis TaxID=1543375 RepID=UPI00051B4B07|nr:Mpo1-like protein [Aeromonas finlandensis]